MKRIKTSYPGVYYREVRRLGGPGKEKVYYIVFKKDGKVDEEKVGRQYADDMTPARAARIRGERIERKRLSRKEIREIKASIKWTVERLWQEYSAQKHDSKGLRIDQGRFENYLKPGLGNKEPRNIAQLDIDRLRMWQRQRNLRPSSMCWRCSRELSTSASTRGSAPACPSR